MGNLIKYKLNNKKLEELNLINDSYYHKYVDNTFIVFNSINQILSLIYTNKNHSIIYYDLINNVKITEIKNAHESYITHFRYFFDNINKRDLILSISNPLHSGIKLWNVNNFECLLNLILKLPNSFFTSCLINDHNQIYILTNNNYDNYFKERIKVFDLNGNNITEIRIDNWLFEEKITFIETYYDKKSFKNYVIVCTTRSVKLIDFNEDKLTLIYSPFSIKEWNSLIIYEEKLITSCNYEIKIYNFYTGELLNVIHTGCFKSSIILWNSNYLFFSLDFKSKIGKGTSGMLINLKDSYIHFGDVTKGKIYSGGHNGLDNFEDGFYLNDTFDLNKIMGNSNLDQKLKGKILQSLWI